MIARAWHGAVPAEKAESYRDFLLGTPLKDYRATPGNRGVTILRRDDGKEVHFLLISLWESREAIQAFAGADIGRARYYPEDATFLLAMEPRVIHYEVLTVATDAVC